MSSVGVKGSEIHWVKGEGTPSVINWFSYVFVKLYFEVKKVSLRIHKS